jgi:hypothetical protein
MDIFFTDPSDIPLPPDEVRIRQLQADPWSDGVRLRVYLELTPFQQRPNGEIVVLGADGEEIASISIIETIDPKMEFTLHLRGIEGDSTFNVIASIFYEEPTTEPEAETGSSPVSKERKVVDRAETTFSLPPSPAT